MGQLELFSIKHRTDDQKLSVSAFATAIGVSSATLRNWIRLGVVSADLNLKTAQEIKKSLSTGALERLGKRANKTRSKGSFVPSDYAGSQGAAEEAVRVANIVKSGNLSLETSLFVLVMRLLELRGEVLIKKRERSTLWPVQGNWRRAAVNCEMDAWVKALKIPPSGEYSALYEVDLSFEGQDPLGLFYQTLLKEGHKSKAGSYYTPSSIAAAAIDACADCRPTSFLDPCCGTGQYLLLAGKILRLPMSALLGCDRDPIAVRLARLNLLLAYPAVDQTPSVECRNVLEDFEFAPAVDLIATNPPWGSEKNSGNRAAVQKYLRLASNETFVLFLLRCIRLLADGGRLSFLLPESFLNIRTHAPIRELLLREVTIREVTSLGRAFSGVFTKVIRLDLEKTKPGVSASVTIGSRSIAQERFLRNPHSVIDLHVDEDDEKVLKKIFESEHVTLKNHASWALGIVTGNNAAFVRHSPSRGYEPIFRGSDVDSYRLREPKTFIEFVPDRFQQVAKTELYRATEKLVYRFISNRLTFAYDDQQRLTLNSANILIPRLPGLSMKVALAFLNSDVFQFIFSKKFSTHKVLRGDLEALPFPVVAPSMKVRLETCVDAVMADQDELAQLNELVFEAFALSGEDRRVIGAHLGQ